MAYVVLYYLLSVLSLTSSPVIPSALFILVTVACSVPGMLPKQGAG